MELKISGIEKLVDYVASGIGVIGGTLLTTWKARREANAKFIQATADADSKIVNATAEATALEIIAVAQASACQQLLSENGLTHGEAIIRKDGITQKIEFQERKRLSNVGSVVSQDADNLVDKDVDEHVPDPDWTARFFGYVQDVSSKDMQTLWARLLSGEVQQPGTTSLRTMDTLRNLTHEEAVLFNASCSYVLQTRLPFLFTENEHTTEFSELSHVNLLKMFDCGLVQSADTHFRFEGDVVEYQGYILRPFSGGDERRRDEIEFSVATLTTAGAELYQISIPQFVKGYLKAIANYFRAHNRQLRYAQITARNSDGSMQAGQFKSIA